MSWRSGWYVDCAPKSYVCKSTGGGLPAGGYYFEVTIDEGGHDGTSGYGIHFGICDSTLQLTGTFASAVNAAQGPGGNFWDTRINNSGAESVPGWGSPTRIGGITSGTAQTTGTTFAVAFSTVLQKVWVRNLTLALPATNGWAGGGSEAGDPVANTFGADFSSSGSSPLTGSVYIVVGCSHGSGSVKGAGTINFGATAFVGTPPTGYVSIESLSPGAALNPADNSNIVLSNGNLSFAGTNVPVTFSPAIGGFTSNVGYSSSVRSVVSVARA